MLTILGVQVTVRPRTRSPAMRTPRKPTPRVAKPPSLSLGIVLFGAAAVLGAAGALVRYYGLRHRMVRAVEDAAVEIPAPDLEPLPVPSATQP